MEYDTIEIWHQLTENANFCKCIYVVLRRLFPLIPVRTPRLLYGCCFSTPVEFINHFTNGISVFAIRLYISKAKSVQFHICNNFIKPFCIEIVIDLHGYGTK